ATFTGDRAAVELDSAVAIATAYAPKTAGPHGETDSERGDLDQGLAAATTRVDGVYTTPTEHHNPLEPHATTAVSQGEDHRTVYDATQGIFGVRDRLAEIF